MKAVVVKWRDSRMYATPQMGEDEMHDGVCVVRSVGILVRERKRHIVIARDRIGGEWRGVLAIPRENIVKMVEIVS